MSHKVSHFVVKWSNCPRASHTKVIKTQKNSVSEKGWDNSRVGEMETDLISDELKQLKKDQIEHEKLSKSLRVHLSHSFLFLLNSSKLCKRVHVLHQIGRSRNQKKSKLDGLLKWKWMKVDVNFSSFGPSAFTKNYPLRFNWSSTLARLRPIFIKSFWSLWNPKFWPSTFTPFTLTPFTPNHSIWTWLFSVSDVPLILTSYPTGRFDEFLTRLNQYKNILVLVGAGISTAAGIPGMNKTKSSHVCSIHTFFLLFHFIFR